MTGCTERRKQLRCQCDPLGQGSAQGGIGLGRVNPRKILAFGDSVAFLHPNRYHAPALRKGKGKGVNGLQNTRQGDLDGRTGDSRCHNMHRKRFCKSAGSE